MPNFTLSDDVFTKAAELFGTPLYLYDEKGIRDNIKRLKDAFSWNKNYRQYYAVKALPNPEILKIMLSEGCGIDVSSETELLLADMVGAKGKDIFFSANAMPAHELGMARERQAHINLDDISDIDTLLSFGEPPETLCLRFNPGGSFSSENDIMGSPGQSKYGFTRPQLTDGLVKLKAAGVKGFGLHALLVSNSQLPDYYPRLARLLIETGIELENETGVEFSYINLSGGIGIAYKPEGKPADIYSLAAEVKNVFSEYKKLDMPLFTELGRYVTGPYGFLIARAIHEKDIHKRYIGLDACAANLMRPAMYGAYHHIHVAYKRDMAHDTMYDVTGFLCENNDKFAIDRMLPKIDIGDLVIIHDAGAHSFSMGYQYNGRLRSAEVLYTVDGDYRLIRRKETPEDYFATLYF
ncbi:MAG: diaminopimelate decarboxylase [Christensenellaceae bacterium]|nr:diaminopimelate decarboxylase [Christensenellaceae bacterium]